MVSYLLTINITVTDFYLFRLLTRNLFIYLHNTFMFYTSSICFSNKTKNFFTVAFTIVIAINILKFTYTDFIIVLMNASLGF